MSSHQHIYQNQTKAYEFMIDRQSSIPPFIIERNQWITVPESEYAGIWWKHSHE